MKKPKFITEFKDIPAKRQEMPELPLEERGGNFKEVELGFTEEMALKEAARCLSCRRCIGCGLCLAECDQEAVVYDETPQDITLEADSIIFTSDGTPYDPGRKRELGYGTSANVITSLEFERLASPTGPFGGYILRPFDGDRPRRIAFVQCVGSREEGIGANYCSTVCCSRTFSQAKLAREHLGGVAVTVFHRGLRPIGKRSEIELAGLRAADWIDFIEGGIREIKEDPETGTVTVAYTADGKEGEEGFDLVVLAVGVQAKPEFRGYARTAGLKTNKYKFVARNLADLVAAEEGVAFAGAIEGPSPDSASVTGAIAAAGRSLGPGGSPEREERPAGNGQPGIFACEYGLGLAGNGEDLAKILESKGIAVDGSYPFLCYKEGRRAMAEKAKEAGSLVVLGCHSGSHESLFERALGFHRGRVAVVGVDEVKDLTEEKIKALIGDSPRIVKEVAPKISTVAVIGSGTSGLAAASELLRRGLEVVLIEKSPDIGVPFFEAFRDSGGEAEAGEAFVKAIVENPKARVFASSTVTSLERAGGNLLLEVATQKGKETLETGAVLVATGAGRYTPTEYPYGKTPSIIDQWELAARIGEGKSGPKKVVMIQCVGARDSEHPYCSRYCCKQAISNALSYKSSNPEAEITILHKGVRVFGFEEDLYTDALEQGVSFIAVKDRPEILADTGLKIRASSETDGEIVPDADLVVLSLAHLHGPGQRELAGVLGTSLDDLGFFACRNPLTDPFRTTAEGVFVCGFARQPVMAEEAFTEGVGAAGAIWSALMM